MLLHLESVVSSLRWSSERPLALTPVRLDSPAPFRCPPAAVLAHPGGCPSRSAPYRWRDAGTVDAVAGPGPADTAGAARRFAAIAAGDLQLCGT